MTTRRQFLKRVGRFGGTAFVTAHAVGLRAADGGSPLPKPPPVKPLRRSAGGFTIDGTSGTFPSFDLAHAAARDGDTILVQPATYVMQTNGWLIYKGITLRSAVPGQRYAIAVLRNAQGAIGNGINADGYSRQKQGLAGRLVVTVEDAEVYADGLTYQTGSCAIFADCRSGACPVDLTLRRCFVHDYDQGLETADEYDLNLRTSTVTVEDTIIYQTGCIGSGDANHSIYIGFIASLSMKGCIVANKAKPDWVAPDIEPPGYGSVQGPNYWPVGHLVKSRAKATTIQACRLTAENTTNSNCIEYGNGGDLLVTGSYLEQGTLADSNAFISYGRQFAATNPTGAKEIVSKDGRTNRLRIYQNTFVNSDARAGRTQQYVELSYQTSQAFWSAQEFGAVPADMTAPANQAIENNVFVDNASGIGILPGNGYPGVGTAPGFLSAVGVACAHAVDNTDKLQFDDLVDVANRYGGWRLKAALQGTLNRAPFALVDVAIENYRALSPTTVARTDTEYGAAPAEPAWYKALAAGAWSHLPVSTVIAEQCSDANPNGIVWPSTGVVETYNPNLPLVAGKHPIPGVGIWTYDAFSGGRLIPNLRFVRNGVTYSGTYWVRYGGGHRASCDNSLHAIGPFDGTPVRVDITTPSIPPAIDLDGTDPAKYATFAADGRPGAAHSYNAFAYLRSLNTLLIGQGAGFNFAGGATYAYKFDEDGYADPGAGWLLGQSFYGSGANIPAQEAAWIADNVSGEFWSIPVDTSTPLVTKCSFAQGSAPQPVEVLNLDTAMPRGFYRKGWAIEGARWLVVNQESDPGLWFLIDRAWQDPQKPGRLACYRVTFTGNALPIGTGSSGNQPTAGSAYDFETRTFYVWFAGTNPNAVAADVYRIVPPADLTRWATQAWTVTKITPTAGIVPEPPMGGLQDQARTGNNNMGGWSAYGNFEFVPTPTRGLFYHHRLDVPPLFFKLA